MQRTHISRLRNKALQSECKTKISALGLNRRGECVIVANNQKRFCRKGGGIHAEQRVFKQAMRLGVVRVIICRVGRGGDLLPIEPCSVCQKIADKMGIVIDTIPKEKLKGRIKCQ